jgi:hypothetical protein
MIAYFAAGRAKTLPIFHLTNDPLIHIFLLDQVC